jgi:hypothetical protein
MPRWEVPYESPDRTLLRYLVATVLALATLCPLGALLFGGARHWAMWIVGPLLVAAFITFMWRIAMVGVWTGARGVKVAMVVRTRIVPWPEFDRVWLGPATGFDALALWISTRDGREIETPIWREGTRVAHRNRTKLAQDELSRLMERLRAEARLNT